MRITSAQFIASAVLLLPFSLWWKAPWTIRPTIEIWVYMIFLGIGVTLLATVTFFYLIEELGVGTALTTIYLIPVGCRSDFGEHSSQRRDISIDGT